MHKTVILLTLVLISTRILAITPEELARLSEKGASDKRKVDQQLNLDDLHYKLRVDAKEQVTTLSDKRDDQPIDKSDSSKTGTNNKQSIEGNNPVDGEIEVIQKRRATKYSSGQKQEVRIQQEHPQNLRNNQRNTERYPYQSPAQKSPSYTTAKVTGKYVTYSDAVEPDNKKYFGIRRGTWIKAELRRDINNAEPGDVELYLSQEIYGTKHTLPVDTQLFANKGLNTATQRLDMLTTYAITPLGREFVLKARIYDTFKVSGLIGIIDTDDSKIAQRGTTSALAALGNGVLSEVGASSAVGNALSKGGQSIINDQKNASTLDTAQQITIFVAPQPILLRVEETF